MKKRLGRVLALMLTLVLAAGCLPGAFAAGLPPEESKWWSNATHNAATTALSDMTAGSLDEDLVVVYYNIGCGYSQAYVPEYADFVTELGAFRALGYDHSSEGTLSAIWSMPGIAGTVTFPIVVAYNGETGEIVAYDAVHGLDEFKDLLEEAGLYDGSQGPNEGKTDQEPGKQPEKEQDNEPEEEPDQEPVNVEPAKRTYAPAQSTNLGWQDYTSSRWTTTVKSYLYENDKGGVTRVEYISGTIVAEDYDEDFQFVSGVELPMELEKWGGFFAGEEYNFLIFGQDNPEEDPDREVVRIVKYSKDWRRLDWTCLKGANTVHPFSAGSLRCAERDGMLYIRTCHEMYASARDGRNHQANMTIAVRERDMTVTDSYYIVMNSSVGYVSHSFNQFVLADREGNLVTVDHGDAYPRGLVVMKYEGLAGTSRFSGSTRNWLIQEFPGNIGDNATGASVGGLAETRRGYVTAYNYDGQGDGQGSHLAYLSFVGKDDETTLTPIPDSWNCTTPVIASLGLGGGYVLWNERGERWSRRPVDDTLYFVRYDAEGRVDEVEMTLGYLSDCAPIYLDGKHVWYVTDSSVPTFCVFDGSTVTTYGPRKEITDESLSVWAKPEVESAVNENLVPKDLQRGYSWNIERQEFCQVMMTLVRRCVGMGTDRYLASRGLVAQEVFADTNNKDVLAAYALGIVKGVGDDNFNPYGSITRQEAATMLMRTAKVLGLTSEAGMAFADESTFAPWAIEGIAFVSGVGDPASGKVVMGGVGGGCFDPLGTYTREQSYLTAYRLFRALKG